MSPLGLAFSDGARLPEHYIDGAFIGEHSSWNRSRLSGYKVIVAPFDSGKMDA